MVERTNDEVKQGGYVDNRKCQQKQCIYNQFGGCHACAECGEAPNTIKCGCSVCLACENIPDMLRWDNGTKEVNPAVKVKTERETPKRLVVINETN